MLKRLWTFENIRAASMLLMISGVIVFFAANQGKITGALLFGFGASILWVALWLGDLRL